MKDSRGMKSFDEYYMKEAIKEAEKAYDSNEVPVGAVVVYREKIIGRAHNQIKLLKDPTAHAEMIALTQAAAYLGSERLLETTVYATIEPCAMCAGAMILGRVKRLVFGAIDLKTGAFGSVLDLNKLKLNHKISVTKRILENECAALLKEFFKIKRRGRLVA
ncbi:MAG: tRNA adenosine(34) deaminase TadA [Candidatus Omnitrophica bacterium]|nr:tRNA adenosine(34) deaminase TadA [Candidatus Omnitrophota bacterium]